MPDTHHVVVDGSNLATEGRTLPSLVQLDEAVRSYAHEDPTADIVVVVDASFEHRIDASERAQLEEAELHGEIVSPPAGAIGRGDAFVLRIAQRTGAVVLSNDSFQEFHGEHPWLFDEGRLIGGKPVPGVGWIFTPRSPVRGAKSRQATGKSKRGDRDISPPAPVKAAELAKAAKKMAALRSATRSDGSRPEVGDVLVSAGDPKKRRTPKGSDDGGKEKSKLRSGSAKEKSAKADHSAKSEKAKPTKRGRAAALAVGVTTKVAKTAKKTPTKRAVAKKGASKKAAPAKAAPVKAAPTKAASAKTAAKKAPAKKAAGKMTKTSGRALAADKTAAKGRRRAKTPAAGGAGSTSSNTKSRRSPAKRVAAEHDGSTGLDSRAARRPDPELAEAIDKATAEALAPPQPSESKGSKRKGGDAKSGKKAKGSKRRRRSSTPPPAVNEPLAFITFVASCPLGSEVQGEVASFTSHGAMIEVDLPEGGVLHCYIPLAGLGRPAPTKAREVLTRGERRTFELVSLDPPRRVAELALPGLGQAPAIT